MNRYASLQAFMSALLFALAAPAGKLLLVTINPWLLAGIFYAGSGLGLGLVKLWQSRANKSSEAAVSRADLPWLAGAVIAGGVIAPVLMMFGLAHTEASAASLLLTLEGVATALIAWFCFHENVDTRVALGMACIVGGTFVLAWQSAPQAGGLIGPAAIAAACVMWAIDNNLTRKVSLADPVTIAMTKGLVAGPVNFALALLAGAAIPSIAPLTLAAFVGFASYGVSLVFYVRALRDLGTSRTAAYFSTAPFIGGLLSIVVLHEALSARLLGAGALMAVGVWLHLTERHEHEHEHEPVEHTHRHTHDVHHQHAHTSADPPGEPHTHRHAHARLRHSHAHTPDSHHRHRHERH